MHFVASQGEPLIVGLAFFLPFAEIYFFRQKSATCATHEGDFCGFEHTNTSDCHLFMQS